MSRILDSRLRKLEEAFPPVERVDQDMVEVLMYFNNVLDDFSSRPSLETTLCDLEEELLKDERINQSPLCCYLNPILNIVREKANLPIEIVTIEAEPEPLEYLSELKSILRDLSPENGSDEIPGIRNQKQGEYID